MQAEAKQKPNANQVICEKCGKWTDFANDRCPLCGASLFGGQTDNEEKIDKPHDTEQSQLAKKELWSTLFIVAFFLMYVL